MRKVSLRLIVIITVAVLFVSAIAGAVYYNEVLSDRNSQIASLNQQIAKDKNQIANLTAQVNDLKDSTVSNEKLTLSNENGLYESVVGSGIFNWNITFDITNNGNATAIINNIIIDGQSYSLNPVPTISPSVENGYALSPNQTILVTIRESNSTFQPFRSGGVLYVTTAIGNSYSFGLGGS